MQVLADTLYRQPAQAKASQVTATQPTRDVGYYARMGGGRSLAAWVRGYFARGWTVYAANARAAAPIAWL